MALGLAVFVLSLVLDLLWVRMVVIVTRGEAKKAALYSGGMQLVGMGSTLLVVNDPVLLIANVAGHMAGAYLATKGTK